MWQIISKLNKNWVLVIFVTVLTESHCLQSVVSFYFLMEDEISSAVLHQKLDLDEITAVLRTRRLRWYGHVQCATSCINSITRLGFPGTRDRGRPRKTWSACVRNDMTICNLDGVNPFMENECEALPGVAYPGVRDDRSTLNTKTGYDMMMWKVFLLQAKAFLFHSNFSNRCQVPIRVLSQNSDIFSDFSFNGQICSACQHYSIICPSPVVHPVIISRKVNKEDP